MQMPLPRRVVTVDPTAAGRKDARRSGVEALRSARAAVYAAIKSSGALEKRNYIELECYTWSVQPEEDDIAARHPSPPNAIRASGYLYGFGIDGHDVIRVSSVADTGLEVMSPPPSLLYRWQNGRVCPDAVTGAGSWFRGGGAAPPATVLARPGPGAPGSAP